MDMTSRILSLLQCGRDNPVVNRLLQTPTEDLVFSASRPIDLHQIKNIYRLRANRNQNLGEPIKGFHQLMEGLEAFSDEAVVIYSVDSETIPFKVFADAAGTELAGVLEFPQELAAISGLPHAELQAV